MNSEKVIMYISTEVRDYLLKEVTADIKKPNFKESVEVLEQVIEALNSYNGEGSIMTTVQARGYINFRTMCLADRYCRSLINFENNNN